MRILKYIMFISILSGLFFIVWKKSEQKGFAILIENLFSDIRVLEPDDELRTEDEISEKSLRNGIKEFLPKIQEY